MPISVINQLPVSRDERIEVELISSSSEPSERNPDDREGLLVWNATYEPGESREIDFGYRVIFPEGLSVIGF